jgi:hypothetical protein
MYPIHILPLASAHHPSKAESAPYLMLVVQKVKFQNCIKDKEL